MGKLFGKKEVAVSINRLETDRKIAEVFGDEVVGNRFEADNTKGFVCLGYSEKLNYIWSNFKQTLFILSEKDFSKRSLENMLGYEWIYENYPLMAAIKDKDGNPTGKIQRVGTDYKKLEVEIMNGCQKAGYYLIEKQKGSGIWLNSNGNPVVNSKEVWSTDASFDGSRIQKDSVYIYRKDLDITKESVEITKEEINKVVSCVKSFKWKRTTDYLLKMGFISHGLIAGALDWRVHLYVHGEAGSGKSTDQEFTAELLGKNTILVDGGSSEAGIRQKVQLDAMVVQVDESEADGAKIANIISMFRSASSGAKVLRGTSDQQGTDFELKFCGFLSGIVPITMNQADSSRFLKLDMLKIDEEHKKTVPADIKLLIKDKKQLNDLGKKLQVYMIWHYNDLMEIFKEVKALLLKGNSDRYANTYGTILACSYLLTDGYVAKGSKINIAEHKEKIASFISQFDFSQEQERSKDKDHEQMLESLLIKEIANEDNKNKDSVLNYIYHAFYQYSVKKNSNEFKAINQTLGKFGIRVLDEDDLAILIDPSRDTTRGLLKGSRFERGDLSSVLTRIENTTIIKEAKAIGGVQKRNCIKIILNQEKYNFSKFRQLIEHDGDCKVLEQVEEQKPVVYKNGLTLEESFKWYMEHKPELLEKLLTGELHKEIENKITVSLIDEIDGKQLSVAQDILAKKKENIVDEVKVENKQNLFGKK